MKTFDFGEKGFFYIENKNSISALKKKKRTKEKTISNVVHKMQTYN